MTVDFTVLETFINQLRSGEMIVQQYESNPSGPEARWREISHAQVQTFITSLECAFEQCEIELGRLAERVQEQRGMQKPLEERVQQLSRYIDRLITKHHGPGTYQLDGETWSTEENKGD